MWRTEGERVYVRVQERKGGPSTLTLFAFFCCCVKEGIILGTNLLLNFFCYRQPTPNIFLFADLINAAAVVVAFPSLSPFCCYLIDSMLLMLAWNERQGWVSTSMIRFVSWSIPWIETNKVGWWCSKIIRVVSYPLDLMSSSSQSFLIHYVIRLLGPILATGPGGVICSRIRGIQ